MGVRVRSNEGIFVMEVNRALKYLGCEEETGLGCEEDYRPSFYLCKELRV